MTADEQRLHSRKSTHGLFLSVVLHHILLMFAKNRRPKSMATKGGQRCCRETVGHMSCSSSVPQKLYRCHDARAKVEYKRLFVHRFQTVLQKSASRVPSCDHRPAITLSCYFTDTISHCEADSCGFRRPSRDDTMTSLALELQFMVADG